VRCFLFSPPCVSTAVADPPSSVLQKPNAPVSPILKRSLRPPKGLRRTHRHSNSPSFHLPRHTTLTRIRYPPPHTLLSPRRARFRRPLAIPRRTKSASSPCLSFLHNTGATSPLRPARHRPNPRLPLHLGLGLRLGLRLVEQAFPVPFSLPPLTPLPLPTSA
jgi:hypothetical protein